MVPTVEDSLVLRLGPSLLGPTLAESRDSNLARRNRTRVGGQTGGGWTMQKWREQTIEIWRQQILARTIWREWIWLQRDRWSKNGDRIDR
jgi:hypothetical protein